MKTYLKTCSKIYHENCSNKVDMKNVEKNVWNFFHFISCVVFFLTWHNAHVSFNRCCARSVFCLRAPSRIFCTLSSVCDRNRNMVLLNVIANI